jgi:hypothetical protein
VFLRVAAAQSAQDNDCGKGKDWRKEANRHSQAVARVIQGRHEVLLETKVD